ncbi:MAG: hypothetical protein AAB734_02630 [Patescibacteria group bacterium]
MKLNRIEWAGIVASFMVLMLAGVFFMTQGVAHADVDPCDLPGMGMLGCEDNEGDVGVPVDPCEITPCDGDEPSLGEEITCAVYEELMAQGEPIPQGFDASACDGDDDDDGDGGGDGDGDTPACADGVDNDGDSLVDSADPGCADSNDDDETNSTDGGGGSSNPACSDNADNDGDDKVDMDDPGCSEANDTNETDPSPSSGGSNNGGVGDGGSDSVAGSVAGSATSTPGACDKYLTAFIKFGAKNDADQVKRLQHVLLWFEGANIEESGVYDEKTLGAVHAFQTKHWDTILAPWNIKQSTGFVYLTTRKKVNEIYCKNEVMFPLSTDENAVIEKTKRVYTSTVSAPAMKPAAKSDVKPKAKKEEVKPAASATTTTSPVSSPIRDFFRRLFNRGR